MAAYLQTGQAFGVTHRCWSGGGMLLRQVVHTCRRELPVHSHEAAYVCMLVAGSYREHFGSRILEYDRFRAGVHPAHFTHRDALGEKGGRLFMIELEPRWFDVLGEFSPSLTLNPGMLDGEALLHIRRLYVEYLQDPGLSAMQAESWLLETLGAAMRMRRYHESAKPHWLERVRQRAHAEFDRSLTVAALAKDAGVHPVHLARTFRQRFGCTLGTYLNRVRVEQASRMLAEDGRCLSDVALECGFADQSHLTRMLKHYLNATPAAYRKLTRSY